MADDVLSVVREYLPDVYKNTGLPNIPNAIVKKAWDAMMHDLHTRKDMSQDLRDRIINLAYASSGAGGYFNQVQQFMTCLDQFDMHAVQPNTETSGLTFITRPRLCLQSSNLRNNRIMTALDTLNPTSMAFAIRCLLDSNFGHANGGRYFHYINNSPIFDPQNAFLVPACNALVGFSGGQDIVLQTQTTEGGFQCEAQTFAIGSDNLQRGNYQLQLTFRDAQHGPITALFFYWLEYMRCVTRGSMMAYADDIDEQRLNYTVSIYRFLLDPSRRYITKYAKFTGCFPTALSIGAMFNKNPGEYFVQSASNITVPFMCNKIEYMDYAILMDFNTLVRRYCPSINWVKGKPGTEHEPNLRGYQSQDLLHPNLPRDPFSNWRGLPYITSDMHGMRLEYRRVENPVFDRKTDLIDQLLYIDMQNKLILDSEKRFVSGSHYTPEFLKQSEKYKGVTMNDFFNRVLSNNETDSKGFESIPIVKEDATKIAQVDPRETSPSPGERQVKSTSDLILDDMGWNY